MVLEALGGPRRRVARPRGFRESCRGGRRRCLRAELQVGRHSGWRGGGRGSRLGLAGIIRNHPSRRHLAWRGGPGRPFRAAGRAAACTARGYSSISARSGSAVQVGTVLRNRRVPAAPTQPPTNSDMSSREAVDRIHGDVARLADCQRPRPTAGRILHSAPAPAPTALPARRPRGATARKEGRACGQFLCLCGAQSGGDRTICHAARTTSSLPLMLWVLGIV